ncbi:MAG: hypothetical protein GF416_03280 [Candidatus Altiarchaeales archaeon]|nr:hypothetical protein [Candidatus Altiarchaeales archaeon]MBD3416141.1 hypothetical protein [Candidatus Altiarchaeales archaeon]
MVQFAEKMKVAVLYFTLTGNTGRVAEILEDDDVDLIQVKGGSRLLSLLGLVRKPKFDAVKYDLIVVGCPVWYKKAAPPFVKALKSMDFGGKQVNAFITYALKEKSALKEVMNVVKKRNGSPGRTASFNVSKGLEESEVRKLLSF